MAELIGSGLPRSPVQFTESCWSVLSASYMTCSTWLKTGPLWEKVVVLLGDGKY